MNFSGEISENVIIDNDQNIFSDYPLKLDPNYIGQFPESPMKEGFAGFGSVRPKSNFSSVMAGIS
jgi:hypothetical protein